MVNVLRKLAFLVPTLVVFLGILAAQAQDQVRDRAELLHTPLKATELSDPGIEIELAAHVINSSSLKYRVRAIVVSDGKLIEVPQGDSFLDGHDRPTYTFKLFAPLVELSYQFLLYDDEQVIDISKRYHIQRDCVPKVSLEELEEKENQPLSAQDKMKHLLLSAQVLERELQNYEIALTFINGLQELTDKK